MSSIFTNLLLEHVENIKNTVLIGMGFWMGTAVDENKMKPGKTVTGLKTSLKTERAEKQTKTMFPQGYTG